MDQDRPSVVHAAETDADRPSGWPEDGGPTVREGRRPLRPWRLLACGVIGFFGTYGILLAFSAYGLPTLLLFIVVGVGAATIDARRIAFLAAWLGGTVYFVIMTMVYLGTRPDVEAQYDVMAPAIVVIGSAIVAFMVGSGYLLNRLLRDSAPDRTVDG